ncbi:hypothetical protein [Janibacter sp. GS2]|uniref:hypothetical protein n=1 Tax=Janibacter sp. GS2 TaxID=3442646 RepID=UPI003EBEF379
MSIFAVLLIAVGTGDLARSMLPRGRYDLGASASISILTGVAMVWLAAGLAGLVTGAAGWLLTALATVSVVAWVGTAERSLSRGRGHVAPLLVLAGGLAAQLALSGWAPPVHGPLAHWLDWAHLPWSPQPDRTLLLAGLALVQLSTGNLVVRLVLISTGAMQAAPTLDEPSGGLKGGRLLGPLERLFILGLGLAGQVTSAGLVIAAKGLIRWPELNSHSRDVARGHIDKVTEYFLVGSFVSWLVALSALALAA